MRGGGRGGARPTPWHPKMVWRPPLQTRRSPQKSLKMLLLGAIFEKHFLGRPPDPPNWRSAPPPWKFPILRPWRHAPLRLVLCAFS